ncbi:Fyv7/TAP26 [Scheffersomyces amazonensis]|uniref:Fyv7/TAP26 n=1 Tax=Scheffersomyces amazonensis TaxID=1078765 RepID=UPI00315DAF3F
MAEARGRGGYRGKSNRYVDRREAKSAEIKKSLTHRARLRKSYFKLLAKEGGEEEVTGRDRSEDNEETKRIKGEEKEPKRFSYAERAQIVKERKEHKRKEELERVREKRRYIEKRAKDRELKKERVTQTTRKGQPLMGPRITNLLDKIRKDMQ